MSSSLLKEHISQHIQAAGGVISFAEFMSYCLYTPELGYYTSNKPIIGEQGDFVTAPEISPLFGFSIANQIHEIYQQDYDILEFGAGNGSLCRDVLLRLAHLDALPEHYYILEVSGYLRAQQQQTLSDYPELLARVQWLTELPKQPIKGVVLANEVLDAMPVEVFRVQQGNFQQAYIEFNENLEWQFVWQACSPELLAAVKELEPLPDGYQSEINLSISPWLASIYDILAEGCVLLFDYGFPQSSYYHPDRHHGTLMCHYQHRTHPDPLINVGQQDITAHVNFTAVAEAAYEKGFAIHGFTNQASFLIGNRITDFMADLSANEQIQASQAVQKLTMPHEMGELFKCIALTKCWAGDPMSGFTFVDYLHHL